MKQLSLLSQRTIPDDAGMPLDWGVEKVGCGWEQNIGKLFRCSSHQISSPGSALALYCSTLKTLTLRKIQPVCFQILSKLYFERLSSAFKFGIWDDV